AGRPVVDRHVAPSEQDLAFLGNDALEERDAGLLVLGLRREEDHADAIAAGRGKADPPRSALATEEGIGNLDQDAGSVTGQRVAAAGAAMGEVLQHGERLLDDV